MVDYRGDRNMHITSRRLILSILFIICLSFQASAWNIMVVGSGNQSSASCDTSNVDLWWRCEALDFSATNGCNGGTGEDCAVSDDTAANNNCAINADASYFGTGTGLDCPTSNDYVSFSTPLATMDDEGRLGLWIRITTWQDEAPFYTIYDDSQDLVRLRMDGTDELEVYWRDNGTTRTALTTNNANLSTGIFYFIEFAWKTSSNLREIYLNGTELTYAAGDGADISSFDGDVDTLYFGDSTSAASYDVHMDNIIYSTDSTVDLYTVCKDEEEWPE